MISNVAIEPIILVFLTSFVVVMISTPSVIRISYLKHLVDSPDSERKLHGNNTPTIGGVVIFAGTLFSALLWYPEEGVATQMVLKSSVHYFKYILACSFILFFVGLKDDLFATAPVKKLWAHIIVAFILVFMADVRITGMKGIFGIHDIPYPVSIILSVFTYTVIVNSLNLIDGVDGLAGGVGFIISTAFGMWFIFAGGITSSLIAFSMAGALLGFLYYNFPPAKIFMGDSGSLFIGLILSVLSIRLIEYDTFTLPKEILSISKPVFVLSCLSYPLIDTLRVFLVRIARRRSPFSADRNHIHHRLQDIGLSHRGTSFVIYGYTILMIVISTQIKFNPSLTLITMMGISIAVILLPFLFKKKNTMKLNVVKSIHTDPQKVGNL